MERINVAVSDEAKEVLVKYQRKNKIRNLEKAMNALLIEFGETC